MIASIIFFAVGTVIGAAIASRFPGLADHFGDSITGFLKTFRGLPKPQLAAAIFLNNSVKTLAAILLGLAIGIVPALFLVVNGVVLGVVFFLSSHSRGVWPSLLGILPHGVIELAAVFLGTAIGLMFGDVVLKRLLRKSDTKIRAELGRAMRFFSHRHRTDAARRCFDRSLRHHADYRRLMITCESQRLEAASA